MSPAGTVTFIGLGNMGLPMATRLRAAGMTVHGFDLSSSAMERFQGNGAPRPSTVAEATAVSDVVITMLPDGQAVQAALLETGVHGALRARRPVVVDMSSSAPGDTQRLGAALAAFGVRLIDAPVSGGVPRAREGTLAIMVGGDTRTVEAASATLATMGSDVIHVGPLGAGHAMKALNNFVSACGLTAASEATVIGEKFGISRATMIEVLNRSTGRNNATESKFERYILSGTFDSGFPMRLMAKDLDIARGLASGIGVVLPMLDAVGETWTRASSELGPGADHTEIARFAASLLGDDPAFVGTERP